MKLQSELAVVRSVDKVIFLIIVSATLLLPIERGAPRFGLFGTLIPVSVLAISTGAVYLVLTSPGVALVAVRSAWVRFHGLLVFAGLIGTTYTSFPGLAAYLVVQCFTTFILVYVVTRVLMKHLTEIWLLRCLNWFIVANALVLIAEGVLRVYIPLYRDMFLYHDYASMGWAMAMGEGFRALGVQGNAIVSATVVGCGIGIAAVAYDGVARYLFVGLYVVAAAYTGARTFVLILVGVSAVALWTFSCRYGQRSSHAFFRVLLLVGSLAVVAYMSAAMVTAWDVSLVNRIVNPSVMDARNVLSRVDQAREGLAYFMSLEVATQLLGAGFGSVRFEFLARGLRVAATDNVYVTLAHDAGLLGLLGYIGAFIRSTICCARSFAPILASIPLSILLVGMSFDAVYYTSFNVIAAVVTALASTVHAPLAPGGVRSPNSHMVGAS